MNGGLIAFYVLIFINLLFVANKHGEEVEPKYYNFWRTLIANVIMLILIWWVSGWKFI